MAKPKIALSWENLVDAGGAVLTASEAVGDTAVANLASPIVGRRWRALSTTAWAQIAFAADAPVGVLALRFPRDTSFPLAGTVTHTLDPAAGTGGAGAVYSSGALAIGTAAGYGYHVHMLPSPVTAGIWRFAFDVSGVDFLDVGRAWAGTAWRPTYNIAFGYEDEWADLSRISASSRSGAEFADERARQRLYAFALEALEEWERDEVREMQRIVGVSRQVLFVKDPLAPARETLLGRLAASQPIRHPDMPVYTKAFTVRESL